MDLTRKALYLLELTRKAPYLLELAEVLYLWELARKASNLLELARTVLYLYELARKVLHLRALARKASYLLELARKDAYVSTLALFFLLPHMRRSKTVEMKHFTPGMVATLSLAPEDSFVKGGVRANSFHFMFTLGFWPGTSVIRFYPMIIFLHSLGANFRLPRNLKHPDVIRAHALSSGDLHL